MSVIRSATELDIHTITEIYAHHVRHGAATFEIEPPDLLEMERRRLEVVAQGLPYVAAESDGRVLGYAYAGRYRQRPAYRFTVEDSIYIHPDFRARGFGRMLLSALIDDCGGQGYRQMIAIIGDAGNTASVRLHERHGFRKVGVLEGTGRKFGRWIDTVLMQLTLNEDGRVTELKRIVEQDASRLDTLKAVVDFLHRTGDYRWVGLYDVDHGRGEVRNLVFSGPGAPEYPTFSIHKGLSSIAVSERRTVNAGDVSEDPHYLTAFGTTRSEMIVPIFDDVREKVIGTIDIESEKLDAFFDREQVFLEDCAEALRPLWSRG